MKIKARIHVHTFPKGQTSGSCIPVVNILADIEFVDQQVTSSPMCSCSELVIRQVPVVNILGRRFIVSKSHFSAAEVSDYTTAVPQDLAEQLTALDKSGQLACSGCGCLHPVPVLKRDTVADNTLRVYSFVDRHMVFCQGTCYENLNVCIKHLNPFGKKNLYVEVADEYSTARFIISEWERGSIKLVR
jgi:hypothetical protein